MTRVYITGDIGHGDGGKGSTVDRLVRTHIIRNVVRYNGGSQAAHNVITPDGKHFCFAQFGSGTLAPETRTFLSSYMLVSPTSMEEENEFLIRMGVLDAMKRMFIDHKCPVITPFNAIINRMIEISRGNNRHGSCGKGIGQTAMDHKNYGDEVLLIGDLSVAEKTKEKLYFFWRMRMDLAEQLVDQNPDNKPLVRYLAKLASIDIEHLVERYRNFTEKVNIVSENFLFENIREGGAIFEGAQGSLLDADYGFWPYVTRSNSTLDNANNLIDRSGYMGKIERIGITRAYATRHGAGPFVTEDSQLSKSIPPCHNGMNKWQGKFRNGWLDLVAIRYGLELNKGTDYIELTNLDRLSSFATISVCTSYRPYDTDPKIVEKFFFTKKDGEYPEITGIKKEKRDKDEQGQLTKILMRCKPLEYRDFKGWESNISDISKYSDLPAEAREYVSFLSSSEGLGLPINIVSVGPKSTNKISI